MAVAVLVSAALLASCVTSAPSPRTGTYLDEKTAATVTRVGQPFILFSDDPARAANARDYIYAAPLAVNQGGKRSWWLWLGVWSTIDRGATATGDARRPAIAAIQLIVAGEPMELDLGTRVDNIPGVGRLPYATPVATANNILLPLTGSQVTRLSRGTSIVIHTEMTGGTGILWQPWIGSGSWTNFAELATADSAASP